MERTVPRKTLRTTCQLSIGSDRLTDDDNVPVRILARTGGPIDHWYWGRIVHDLDGMKHKSSVPIDWSHNYDQELGYLNKFSTSDGDLVAAGELVPFQAGDRVHQITHRASRGVPYEASIDWSGGAMKLEEIGDGEEAEVNGRTISGPATIVREWQLTAVAICPHGADSGTATQFADNAEQTVTIIEKEHEVPRRKMTDPVEEPAVDPVVDPVEPQEEAAPETEAMFTRTQIKAYCEEFGPEGLDYLLRGLTREQSLEQQRQQLQAEIADLQKELSQQMDAIKQLKDQMEAARQLTVHDDGVSGRPDSTAHSNGRRSGIVPIRQ